MPTRPRRKPQSEITGGRHSQPRQAPYCRVLPFGEFKTVMSVYRPVVKISYCSSGEQEQQQQAGPAIGNWQTIWSCRLRRGHVT